MHSKTSLESAASEKEVTLLGLIAEEPIHAYGLEEKIRERSIEDWTTLSRSSIYRLLQNLEERGLVSCRFEHGGQGATRKVFSITAPGIEALATGVLALLGGTEQFPEPFLVGLSNSHYAPREAAVEQLAQRRAVFENARETLRAIRSDTLTAIQGDEQAAPYGVECVYQLFFHYILERMELEVRFLERAARELADAPRSTLTAPDEGVPG
jgi:DNA-binding PadR family transcriptional regulator